LSGVKVLLQVIVPDAAPWGWIKPCDNSEFRSSTLTRMNPR